MQLAPLLSLLLFAGACGRLGFEDVRALTRGVVDAGDGGTSSDGSALPGPGDDAGQVVGPGNGDAGTGLPGGGDGGPGGGDGGPGGPGGGDGGTIGVDGGADAAVGLRLVSDDVTASIAAGLDQGCAVRADGNAACWGYDGNGERGNGTGATDPQAPPSVLQQQSAGALRGVDTGFVHVCGLANGGSAWCWGDNFYGQLGNSGATQSADEPVRVSGGLSFDSLAVGSHHACAIDTGAKAWCWGRSFRGRLGNGSGGTDQSSPGPVTGGLSFSAISAGASHTCAVERSTNLLYCWGDGADGRLGTGDLTERSAPARVSSDLGFRSVDAGTIFTCALTLDDRALCWGDGGQGQLGDGAQTQRSTPVEVTGGLRFGMLAVSGETSKGFAPAPHACGLTPAGKAYCWGSNEYGQLGAGDASRALATAPIAVDQSQSGAFVTIAAGFGFTCAIDTADAAWCWGFDGTGELGTGAGRQDSQIPLRVALP